MSGGFPTIIMDPKWSMGLFAPTCLITFNFGVWQLYRRRWKMQVMGNFDRLNEDPIHEILPVVQSNAVLPEYRRVELTGTFDNEATMLVGPRPAPAASNVIGGTGQRGGFQLLTPFEVAGTNQIIMVNRGWVPIDAHRSRLHRVQYTGEGVSKLLTVRGFVRHEEKLKTAFGTLKEANYAPLDDGLGWLGYRPYDMVKYYFKDRFGGEHNTGLTPEEAERKYGARHYYVECYEDHSGDDQRVVKGSVYPFRRDLKTVNNVFITPGTHLQYAFFWFFISAVSGGILRHAYVQYMAQYARNVIALKRVPLDARERRNFLLKSIGTLQSAQYNQIRDAATVQIQAHENELKEMQETWGDELSKPIEMPPEMKKQMEEQQQLRQQQQQTYTVTPEDNKDKNATK